MLLKMQSGGWKNLMLNLPILQNILQKQRSMFLCFSADKDKAPKLLPHYYAYPVRVQ